MFFKFLPQFYFCSQYILIPLALLLSIEITKKLKNNVKYIKTLPNKGMGMGKPHSKT
jgi:hypothetical protein